MAKDIEFYKMPAEERYFHEVMFHQLVDQMEHFIREAKYSPSEMREAAILAGIHYEQKQIRTIVKPLQNERKKT